MECLQAVGLGGWALDLVRRRPAGRQRGEALPKEHELLDLLVQHAGKVLTHKFLLQEL
jgi:two-component system KDP operon response regulator KdpE